MNAIRESEVCTVFLISSGWFKHIELLKMNDTRESEVCRVLSHKFGVVQAHRPSSNLLRMNDIERARCVEFFHISSGCFYIIHSEEVR